jgi:hypothetical protein
MLLFHAMLTSKTTTACQANGHPEFEIEYDSEYALDIDADWLLSFVVEQVRHGTQYLPGQTIQIGWMTVRIEKTGDKLVILEPEMGSLPIRFQKGVTNTLRHLRLQKSAAESVGLETSLDFPSVLQSGIACLKHEDSVDFVMDRALPQDGRDSGWFVGCTDRTHDHNDPANLRRASLYEIACAKPECIPFLALPQGSFVLHEQKTIKITYQQTRLDIKPNSYLAHQFRRNNL